ncbi:MAG: hypothetical protein IJL30_05335 [Clostridia bacterium]|nr:hypothetical protein [Clostridia bacterium]
MFDNPRKKIINSVITAVAVFMVLLTSCANNSLNRFKAAIDDGYYRTAQAIFEETTDPQFFDEAEYFIRDKADEVLTSYSQGESDYKETAEYLANYESFFDMTDEKLALETISESKKFYWNAKEAENEHDYPLAAQYYDYVSSLDTENYDTAQQSIENIRSQVAEEFISELNKYKEKVDYDGAMGFVASNFYVWGSKEYFIQIIGEETFTEGTNIVDETLKLCYIKEIEDTISNIGAVTLKSEKAISSARSIYNYHDSEIQKEVSNYSVLISAEESLRNLQIEDIEKAINAIGTVTLSSSDAIKTARKVYNSYSAEIKNAVSNYSVLTDAEKKIEELQINDALKKAEDYVAKGDYANAIKSLDSSISKYGKSASLSARRAAYADSYVKETIASAASKYKKYDYNALMAAENVLKTALNVLSNEKKLKDELAYYKELEPIPLTDVECNYNTGWWGERYRFQDCGRQTSVSGYVYNYTLAPEDFEDVDGEIGATYPYGMVEQYFSNYQYSKLTGKIFFNEKYKSATSAKTYLLITVSLEKNRYIFSNDGITHSFEIDLTGVKEFFIQYGQTEEMNDLAFLADVYLWKK